MLVGWAGGSCSWREVQRREQGRVLRRQLSSLMVLSCLLCRTGTGLEGRIRRILRLARERCWCCEGGCVSGWPCGTHELPRASVTCIETLYRRTPA